MSIAAQKVLRSFEVEIFRALILFHLLKPRVQATGAVTVCILLKWETGILKLTGLRRLKE